MRLKFLILLIFFVVGIANGVHTKIIGVRTLSNGELRGVVANLTVEIRNGSGRVFVETKPLTQIDTQASARLAKEVACNILEKNCSKYDFFYIIESDFEIIGGPSAGAAMAAATIAALHGVKMNTDVFITGTINPAGSIGPVGAIFEKAEAVYENNGKIFLIPKGLSVVYINGKEEDITIFAKKNWGLRIIEVSDITDAYKYLTGYEIVRRVKTEDIASKKYNEVMKALSEDLLKEAKNSYKEADGKLNSSPLTFSQVDEIKEILKGSKSQIELASKSYEKGEYYSSSSFSVRSLISSKYAILKINYYIDGEDYLERKISKLELSISSFEKMFLRNRKIDDFGDIEIYSVVIDRIREAEEIFKNAKEAYPEDIERTIYLLAFADVRKNTAYNWLTLIAKFKGNLSLTFNPLNMKDISQERIQQSKTSIVYASTVTSNQVLKSAKEHLKNAISAYEEEKYVFALFEASKARAEANLAMEIRGVTNDTVQDKINKLEIDAKIAIKKAEERGLIPILALSYLEFGKTLRNKDPVQSLIYLSYSREMAQISQDLVEATVGKKLSQNGVEIREYHEIIKEERILSIELLVLITGILIGAILTLYLLENR